MFSRLIRSIAARLRHGPQSTPPDHPLFIPDDIAGKLDPAAHGLLKTAISLHRTGRHEGALKALRALLRLAPGSSWGYALLGMVLAETGDSAAAEDALAKARTLAPSLLGELAGAGVKAKLAFDTPRAMGAFLLAEKLFPAEPSLKSQLADVCFLRADKEAALGWIDAAWRASGRDGLRVKRIIILLEPIYASMQHLIDVRDAYLGGLRELADAKLRIEDPMQDAGLTNFLLGYHGMNERGSQALLARILCEASPALEYLAPHTRVARPAGSRLKVGIASYFFGLPHSIGRAYNALLQALAARDDMELTVICVNARNAARMQEQLGPGVETLALPDGDLALARSALAGLGLDVLLYTDIGMDPFTYYLAFGRYALLQGVIAGHPMTTGIPAIDVFVSGEDAEPAGAEAHYTERLVRLSHVPVGMRAPVLPAPRSRTELGLPESGNLYVCPMKLQKFHPEFDAALAGILREDPEAEIVLFADFNTDVWDQRVQQRLERALGDNAHRANFLPWQPSDAFLGILMHADVALDTFHFGAGTTCALVFGAGCPMVTLPAAFMRGRLTYSYYRIMEIDACIATDAGDYVRRAVAIARDRPLRARLGEQIKVRSARLFDAAPVAAELATALAALHREQAARVS